MQKTRLEAFSDGVIAIIITIMVLELKAPHEASLESLRPLLPTLLSYLLSFVYVGIYWSNHHHLFHATRSISGGVLWANLHLLFWLSLIPFVTAWVDGTHFSAIPVAAYGTVLLLSGVAWEILRLMLTRGNANNTLLRSATGRGRKEWASLAIYTIGVGVAFAVPWLAIGLYTLVAVAWLVPDRRIERAIRNAAE